MPRPHQQQCRSNIVEFYESNNSFDKVKCCFDEVETNGTCSISRNFTKNSFDIVAKNGTNVESTFDFVERIV